MWLLYTAIHFEYQTKLDHVWLLVKFQ